MCFYFTHCFLNQSTFHMDGPLFARPSKRPNKYLLSLCIRFAFYSQFGAPLAWSYFSIKVKQIRQIIVILINGSHWLKHVIIENIPSALLEVIEVSFKNKAHKKLEIFCLVLILLKFQKLISVNSKGAGGKFSMAWLHFQKSGFHWSKCTIVSLICLTLILKSLQCPCGPNMVMDHIEWTSLCCHSLTTFS